MNVQKAQSQKADYCPPPPEGDFYRINDMLDESERTVLKRVRDFMDREVAPIIEDYWVRDQFPFDLVPKIAALGIGGVGFKGYGSAGGSMLLNGFISMELARVDSSIATFWGVRAFSIAADQAVIAVACAFCVAAANRELVFLCGEITDLNRPTIVPRLRRRCCARAHQLA
jgi:alkylation response protein AidB-like acyl-CoA dehydrogenase